MLCAAATAGIALTTLGVTGAASAATAATPSLRAPVYTNWAAGYQAQGRSFRFISTTLTVAARHKGNSPATLSLASVRRSAVMYVSSGGGAQSVSWLYTDGGSASLNLSPQVGDQLQVSIYYDRHGHIEFTATDITQGVTRRHQLTVGDNTYTIAMLVAPVLPYVTPPAHDTRLWHFTGSQLTTYTGVHGTILGPWKTSKVIETTNGTSTGKVVMSPSGLRHNGQNFGVFLRHHR